MKKLKLRADEIVTLVEPSGSATATDMITVEGRDIGYIAYLNEPPGSAWERIPGTNRFERVE